MLQKTNRKDGLTVRNRKMITSKYNTARVFFLTSSRGNPYHVLDMMVLLPRNFHLKLLGELQCLFLSRPYLVLLVVAILAIA